MLDRALDGSSASRRHAAASPSARDGEPGMSMMDRTRRFLLAGSLLVAAAATAGTAWAAVLTCTAGVYCVGASGPDELQGSNGQDRMYGMRGSDTLLGGRGADLLRGD